MRVLVIDIGGSDVKVFPPGGKKSVEISSGRHLTPEGMLRELRKAIVGWSDDVVSMGYPGRVEHNSSQEDAPNLGEGLDWVEC